MITDELKTYTPDEVAGILNVSRRHVYDLTNEGKLPFIMVGAAKRIPATALRRWMEENTTVKAAAEPVGA